MREAITNKFVAEQKVLEARYNVLEQIERFKISYVDSEAIRLAQAIVNEGMSEAYLRYLGIQATLELAQSPNAKLVIIGDKDGMPLILNPDTMDVSMTLPEGLMREDFVRPGTEGQRGNLLIETFDTMDEYLEFIDSVLGELLDRFPDAERELVGTGLPQDNRVPVSPPNIR
jgi:hypothetical protein